MNWTPPSGREPAALDPALIDQDDPEYDSSYEAFYGENAGGWKFTFGKHKYEHMNEVPYSYLKFCHNNVKNVVYQEAFQRYRDGLLARIHDKYDEFRVPLGRKHRGKRLRECRDKPWMTWLIGWANRHAIVKDKYDIFLQALQKYLDNPRHQGVHRDIGERLLRPEEYEGDLEGEDEYDEEEYNQDDINDADENGNLAGFVVDDDVVEYEDDANQPSILDDVEEEDANPRAPANQTPCKKRVVESLPTPTRTPCKNKDGTASASAPCSGDSSPKPQSKGYTRTRVLVSDSESDCASGDNGGPLQSSKANVKSAQKSKPGIRMNADSLPQTPTKRARKKTSAALATPQTDGDNDSEDDIPVTELHERYATGNGSSIWTPKSIKHSKDAPHKAVQPKLPLTPRPTPARKKRKAQEALDSDSEYVDSISPGKYAQRMEPLRTRNSQRRKE